MIIPDDLQKLRNDIDQLDNSLIDILSKRFEITHEVGLLKKKSGLPPIDKQREKQQFKIISKKAEKRGLDKVFARKIFRLIIDEVVANHNKLKTGKI